MLRVLVTAITLSMAACVAAIPIKDQAPKLSWVFRDSDVHTMTHHESGELHGAVWMYLLPPVAIKVAYIKTGARLSAPGHPWHPRKLSKIVKLSPFLGATEPIAGPKAVLPDD